MDIFGFRIVRISEDERRKAYVKKLSKEVSEIEKKSNADALLSNEKMGQTVWLARDPFGYSNVFSTKEKADSYNEIVGGTCVVHKSEIDLLSE